jgi:hypothetical protein
MQPKTDKSKPFGWLNLLMIAIVSGLVVRVLGDPLVNVISPKLEDAFEDADDFLDDLRWQKKINRWIDQMQNEPD